MKKILNIVKNIFTWALMIVAVGMMIFTIVSVSTFDHTDRDLFGYKAFIVLSDSMSSVKGDASKGYFDAGDLILVKEVDPSTLKEGDIISYQSMNTENYGEIVTHMIRSITTDAEGNPGFITYGTATDTDDANVVTYPFVVGKYASAIPKVGTFFQFLKTTPGYIVCIFLPFLILIMIQGINSIRLFRKYKAEQLEEIEAERAKEREAMEAERKKLEAERMKQEAMMQKLMEMQNAMMQQAEKPKEEVAKEEEQPKETAVEIQESDTHEEA